MALDVLNALGGHSAVITEQTARRIRSFQLKASLLRVSLGDLCTTQLLLHDRGGIATLQLGLITGQGQFIRIRGFEHQEGLVLT